MAIFKIIDNIDENKFFIMKKEDVFYLIPNKVKDLIYITENEDEFAALFEYENDKPINENPYQDLLNKFLMAENFYLRNKQIGIFHFTSNHFYFISPVNSKKTLPIENFIDMVSDKIMQYQDEMEDVLKKKKANTLDEDGSLFAEFVTSYEEKNVKKLIEDEQNRKAVAERHLGI